MSIQWEKAERALLSAQVLLENGDRNGAVNRAYYSMFYAARSVLVQLDSKFAKFKSHSANISQFSKYLVIERGLHPNFGRWFSFAFKARMAADYKLAGVEMEKARKIVDAAGYFLNATSDYLPDPTS